MAAPRRGSAAVDFATVADAEEMNRVLGNIDDVNYSVVAYSQTAPVRAFQPVMGEFCETSPHFVDVRLDSFLMLGREFLKHGIEAGVVNLEGAQGGMRGWLLLASSGSETLRFLFL